MKQYYSYYIFLLIFVFNDLNSQSFSFHGGTRPNNSPYGTHFSVKADIYSKSMWTFASTYTLVKHSAFSIFGDSIAGFHIVDKKDKTIFDLTELKRGYAVQSDERDQRPMNLRHRLSFFAGYKFINSKNIIFNLYAGPHLSLERTILDHISGREVNLINNEGEAFQVVQYTSWVIYRSWDLGLGSRLEVEYKLFKNVSIGLSSQMFLDVLQGGIDLVAGAGFTYHFSPSKN